MIRPMIDPSFLPYGRIEQPQAAQADRFQPICLSHSNADLYCFPRDTSWDYIDGMTVLLIFDGGTQRPFYLDRPITVYAGVTFGFYSLGQSSTILGDPDLLNPDNQLACAIPAATAPQLSNIDIFTLFRQTAPEGLYFRGEQHPPIELIYVESGILHNFCQGQDLILHPAELLLLGPNQWHMQYADQKVQFITVSFLWEGHDFSDWYNRVIATSSDMQRTLKAIAQEYSQSLPHRDEFLNSQLKLLLLQLLRQPAQADKRRGTSPAVRQMHHQLINKALQVVSSQVRGKLTVPDLAAAVNVSASQLSSLFQTYLGISPAKYITKIRLEESKLLLSDRRMSIGEVASHLGYSSIQHFTKQFHLWYGYTPSAYVKTLSAAGNDG